MIVSQSARHLRGMHWLALSAQVNALCVVNIHNVRYHRRLRGYPIDEAKSDSLIIIEFGAVGDWNEFLGAGASSSASVSASAGDAGEFDSVFKQQRRAAVLESTQMPGRTIRVFRCEPIASSFCFLWLL